MSPEDASKIWEALGKVAQAFYRLGVLDATHRVFHEFNVGAVPEMAEHDEKFGDLYCKADHDATMSKYDADQAIRAILARFEKDGG